VKYTSDEALKEIMLRSERISRRKDQRTCRVLSAAAAGLFALLIFMIAILPGRGASSSFGSVYGSFLLRQESGGYILVAVIAFLVGAAVALLCLRRKKQINDKKDKQ